MQDRAVKMVVGHCRTIRASLTNETARVRREHAKKGQLKGEPTGMIPAVTNKNRNQSKDIESGWRLGMKSQE